MYTCPLSSARQHRSPTAAGRHDDDVTPRGRWASRRGGGAPLVDAPGSNFKLYWERNSNPVPEGIMLDYPRITLALARRPGNKDPRTSGLLLWFRRWLCTGGSVRLCCRAGCGFCAVYGSPDVTFWRGCADQKDTLNCCWSCFTFAFRFSALKFMILAIGCRPCIFLETKKGRGICTSYEPGTNQRLVYLDIDLRFPFCLDMPYVVLGKKWPSRPHGGRARLGSCLMGIISNDWKHRTMGSRLYVDGAIWAEAIQGQPKKWTRK